MGERRSIVILGGGLTGLAAAHALAGHDVMVLERDDEPGGLCRTHAGDGFTFDCTGHLLHLRDPALGDLVERLAPGAFASHERRALIHSQGVDTAYPFQANLRGLPAATIQECIEGFVEAQVARAREGEPDTTRLSFRAWIEATFGTGIAKHFMLPYNAKLWRTDLDEVECGWVSWSIPRPSLREILQGALGGTVRGLGYNPTFLYPRRGGIRTLPDAFAARVEGLRLGAEVRAIDAAGRRVVLADGSIVDYELLVSTLPLDRLLGCATGLPADLPPAGRRLRAVRVLNICLGVDRPAISPAHWIYFPEPMYSFYRVGFPSNLSEAMAPPGCSSVWAERSLLRDEPYEEARVVDETVDDLRRAGILRRADRIVHRRVGVLDPAYVIYDRHRSRVLPGVLKALDDLGIRSTGRFGAWEYNSMEGAMKAGIEAAAWARARLGQGAAARRIA